MEEDAEELSGESRLMRGEEVKGEEGIAAGYKEGEGGIEAEREREPEGAKRTKEKAEEEAEAEGGVEQYRELQGLLVKERERLLESMLRKRLPLMGIQMLLFMGHHQTK